MKKTATTLVHKGAMDIAVHAVSSFARHFARDYRLEIHTDGSPDEEDQQTLLQVAKRMDARIVSPDDRRKRLSVALDGFPMSARLIARGGYFTKFELPITVEKPFFYFDSDIVWLRPVSNLEPPDKPEAFSTESWSWYYGVQRDRVWIREGTPRRVNSGFYHLSSQFPHDRLERLISELLYSPEHRFSTDQEIMAFLYPDMEHYHPEDLKRSRIGIRYDPSDDSSAALHFPGRMWKEHMDQIIKLEQTTSGRPAVSIRFTPSSPLTHMELLRMRATLAVADNPLLRHPVNLFRMCRKMIRG